MTHERAMTHESTARPAVRLAAARACPAAARQARVDGHLPPGEVPVIRRNADGRTANAGYSVGAVHRGRPPGPRALTVLTDPLTDHAHHTPGPPRVTPSTEAENGGLTDEPPLLTVDKGRSLALRTRAHDRP